MAVKNLGSGKLADEPPSVAKSLAGAAQPPAPVSGDPYQLPGAVPPTQIGARMPNYGTFNNPSLTPSLASAPMPPARPPGLGVLAAPAAAVRGSPTSLAANPPLPPVRPQDLGQQGQQSPLQALFGGGGDQGTYSPLQVGNVRGGAPASYTSANLGDILSRIFGVG